MLSTCRGILRDCDIFAKIRCELWCHGSGDMCPQNVTSPSPVFRVRPVEAVRVEDVRQPRLVGEEEGEVGGEDAVLHVAQHLLVLLGAQLGEDVVVLLNTCEGKYVSKSWNVDILFMTPLPLHCVISSGLKPFHCSFNVTILPAAE